MKLKDEFWQPIQDQLLSFFQEVYYNPILEILQDPLYNAVIPSNALLAAITHGRVVYNQGKFTGKFTAQISKELSKFSKFDNRSKSFVVKDLSLIPHSVISESTIANTKSKKLHEELNRRLKDMPENAREKLKTLNFSVTKTADQIEAVLKDEFKQVGIEYKPTSQIQDKLIKDYNQNLKLSIVDENNKTKKWNDEQVERLRDMVEQNAMTGLNRQTLLQSIQNEFDISKRKAAFLARQETSLYLSNLQSARFQDAGVDIYRWSGARDVREVGNPGGLYPKPTEGHGNHWKLNGKYCKFSDDSVYANSLDDIKNNKWKMRKSDGMPETKPGIEFQCRCVAIPIIL